MSKLKQYLEEAAEESLIDKFEDLLKKQDWTHEMSDDHRSWTGGKELKEKLIKAIVEIKKSSSITPADKDKAKKLYEKESQKAHPKYPSWEDAHDKYDVIEKSKFTIRNMINNKKEVSDDTIKMIMRSPFSTGPINPQQFEELKKYRDELAK